MGNLETVSTSLSLSFSLYLSLFVSHSLHPNIWFFSAERFQTTLHHCWWKTKNKSMAVFSLYDLFTSKWEHEKSFCHWKNGRVMGRWLACCLSLQDPRGERGLTTMSFPHNCNTIYGLSWVCMGLWFMAVHLMLRGHCCCWSGHGVKDGVSLVGGLWLKLWGSVCGLWVLWLGIGWWVIKSAFMDVKLSC